MRYDVLVVEDEAGLLRGIVRGLSADPRLHLEGVSTVDRAEEILDSSPPDLLITDIRLPGRSGLDLLLELERRSLRIPVVVITAHMAAYEDRLANRTGLTVLEKPVPLADLRRIVKEKLEAETSDTRSTPFELQDYLQLASLGRYSLAFDVQLPDGGSGQLEVVEGELWNVYSGEYEGESALRLLLESPLADLGFKDLAVTPAGRQLTGSTQSLLLELARRSDEEGRDLEAISEAVLDFESEESAPLVAPAEGDQGPTPAETAVALDALGQLCQRVMGEVKGARACAIVDISTGTLYGRSLADGRSSAPFPSMSGLLVLDLLRRIGGSGRKTPSEALVASLDEVALGHLGSGLDLGVLLEVETGNKQGLAWLALRDTRELRNAGTPLEGELLASAPVVAGPGDIDTGGTDPAIEQLCHGLLSQLMGARMFAVVDPSGRRLIGSSDPAVSAGRSLAKPIPWTVLARFAGASEEAKPLDEVYVSGEDRWWFRALTETPFVIVLWADRTLRPGLARTFLRSAIDPLRRIL